MATSSFVVPLAELENGPKALTFTLPVAWLEATLGPAGGSARGPGLLSVKLEKHGREVMVRGHAELSITLPCVVTLDPVEFDLKPEIFLLLEPESGSSHRAEPGAGSRRSANKSAERGKAKALPNAPVTGHDGARARRTGRGRAEDLELSAENQGRDTFQGDEIVLDDFVREFVLLELPPYPRRPDLPSPEESIVSRPFPGPTGEKPLDPRLEPLAKLAGRLRGEADKE